MTAKRKLLQAKEVLAALQLPRAQQNDRSCWTLLALANIEPRDAWVTASAPLLRTVDIMSFISEHYGQTYAPNSRETFRRQTLHQFEQARLVDRNRDDPSRPTNSGLNNYSLNPEIVEILHEYPDGDWRATVGKFLREVGSLRDRYRREREMIMVPVRLPDGREIKLSAGQHNDLQAAIVHEFCPRFAPHAVLLYIGDTAEKIRILEEEELEQLNIPANVHDKLPDVVVVDKEKNWLFLIEAVTSHGPVSPKRHAELEEMLQDCDAARIYVTAFPDKTAFRQYVADVAWETEVWVADNPDHLVHFNGHKFLGPY